MEIVLFWGRVVFVEVFFVVLPGVTEDVRDAAEDEEGFENHGRNYYGIE